MPPMRSKWLSHSSRGALQTHGERGGLCGRGGNAPSIRASGWLCGCRGRERRIATMKTTNPPVDKCPLCGGTEWHHSRCQLRLTHPLRSQEGHVRLETASPTAPAGTDAGGLGHEVTEPHSPPRSAGATEPCSGFGWCAEPTRAGWWVWWDDQEAAPELYRIKINDGPLNKGAFYWSERRQRWESCGFKNWLTMGVRGGWAGPIERRSGFARNLESHPQSSVLSGPVSSSNAAGGVAGPAPSAD